MKIAYFDCFSGISGDMALGALLGCGVDVEVLRSELAHLKLPSWKLDVQTTSINGIGAIDVKVTLTEPQRHERHLSDIERILEGSNLPETVRGKVLSVFHRLAEAEAKIHQTTPDRIHFHEVGAVDAIVDVVGACIALEQLGVEEVYCSPLPMSRGFVSCAHGIIPLPAPAVLELLRGYPVYDAQIEGELVTPTGAALMTSLAKSFGGMPTMTIHSIGYGAGKRRLPDRPNVLRVVLGEALQDTFNEASEISVLETNLDDFTPQFYEPLSEKLFTAGAVDVYLTPIQMKKNRPATLLTVLAPPEKTEELAELLFTETTTLGVRFTKMRRLCVEREWVTVQTSYGPIRMKIGRWRGTETTTTPEYEDVKAASKAHGVPVKTVYQAAMIAYEQSGRRAGAHSSKI